MIARRSRRRATTAAERLRDRRARRFGILYLAIAAVIAVVHDELLRLPPGKLAHDSEQVALAAMLVLGLLGGLLVIEGRKLFEDPYWTDRTGSIEAEPFPSERPTIDAAAFDTRAGVAMVLARRALAAAAKRSSERPEGTYDRCGSTRVTEAGDLADRLGTRTRSTSRNPLERLFSSRPARPNQF